MSESNYLKTKNIWAEKRPGGVFLKLNNKKPANYGESLPGELAICVCYNFLL